MLVIYWGLGWGRCWRSGRLGVSKYCLFLLVANRKNTKVLSVILPFALLTNRHIL